MADLARRHLRLLRFRPGATVEDVLRGERLREVAASPDLGPGARIFIIDPDSRQIEPSWLSFLDAATTDPLPSMASPLKGAIIFLPRDDRLWALTFGTGHLFVNEDLAEQRFGLKTVLNLVNDQELRSVSSRVYEDVVIRTLRQVSRRSGRDAFTIDDTRDILRDVTGAPSNPSWGTEVTGGTAFSLSIPAEPDELPDLLDRIANANASDAYKLRFRFVDYIAPVSDAALLERLDEDMMSALVGAKASDIYLAPPEPLLYDDVAGFCFFREPVGDAHPELALNDYRRSVGDPDTVTLRDLHTNQVRLISASTGSARRSWSVYRCVVYETTLDDHSYLLAEGDWFEIDPSFVARIDREVAMIPPPGIELPPAAKGEWEPAYNERVAREMDLALLDNKPSSFGGDDFEVADLLTPGGSFIHVKRKTGAKGLSMLFAQGRISAATLKADEAARAATIAILDRDGRAERAAIAGPYDPRAMTVVFAVIAENAADLPAKLPFFSRLNLWHAQRFLAGQLDYQVAFVGIPLV